ncbi:MAG: tetratricopeptide repeat protein [Asgard group archaeon]|nr:tetratricopeptide repeat protein [Asgard group archaeon]
MSSSNEIPEPSDEIITKWSNEIVSRNNLSDEFSYQKITDFIAKYVEEKFTQYYVTASFTELGEEGFKIREKGTPMDDPLDWFKIAGEKELTEEEARVKEYTKLIYLKILSKLDMPNPAKYKEYLKELNLQSFIVPPDYRVSAFTVWADKIINYYKLTNTSSLETIIKKTIYFFDILFPDYSIYYTRYKDEVKYPVFIDKIDDDYLFWISVIDKIRKLIYCTHYQILKKFNRIRDYPKDPDFWFELVLVYEELGLKTEANGFGEMGIALNPRDLTLLTELATFYGEKKRFVDGLIYFKKSAELFFEQKQYAIALRISQNIVMVEPKNKDNWIFLEKTYLAMGNTTEAQRARDYYSKLK